MCCSCASRRTAASFRQVVTWRLWKPFVIHWAPRTLIVWPRLSSGSVRTDWLPSNANTAATKTHRSQKTGQIPARGSNTPTGELRLDQREGVLLLSYFLNHLSWHGKLLLPLVHINPQIYAEFTAAHVHHFDSYLVKLENCYFFLFHTRLLCKWLNLKEMIRINVMFCVFFNYRDLTEAVLC